MRIGAYVECKKKRDESVNKTYRKKAKIETMEYKRGVNTSFYILLSQFLLLVSFVYASVTLLLHSTHAPIFIVIRTMSNNTHLLTFNYRQLVSKTP